jgi:hypothetical protein
MTVRNIAYFKGHFETGDIPSQDDFHDLFDTIWYTPIVVNLTGLVIVDPNDPKDNLHFQVDISTVSNFSSLAYTSSTKTSVSGWEYWNGSSMQPLPSDGLHPAYQDQEIGSVVHVWTGAVMGTVYYIRYRPSVSDVWGDYRVYRTRA